MTGPDAAPGPERDRHVRWKQAVFSLVTGGLIGLLAHGFDPMVLPAFTIVAMFWLMTLGMPKGRADDFRKVVTRFFLFALPTAWLVNSLARAF